MVVSFFLVSSLSSQLRIRSDNSPPKNILDNKSNVLWKIEYVHAHTNTKLHAALLSRGIPDFMQHLRLHFIARRAVEGGDARGKGIFLGF